MNNTNNIPTVVYTTESQIRKPYELLRSMWRDLIASRELAWTLFVRDISALYRQSILGILWAFIPPIVTGIVFIALNSSNLIQFGETDIPYPVFVLVGTILWQVFTDSLNTPLKTVTNAKPMLRIVSFPREALILVAFYTVIFNMLIKMLVLAAVLIIFQVPLSWGLLLSPLAILVLILLGISIGLVLTPVGMLYTDIMNSLTVATQLLFFITPVIYPPPQSYPASLVVTLNPISPPLLAARDLITKGTIGNLDAFLVVSAISVVLFFIGWLAYRISTPIIIERISA